MALIWATHVSRSKLFRDESERISKLTTLVRKNWTHCVVEEGRLVARA